MVSEKVQAHLANLADRSFERPYIRGSYWWKIVSYRGEGDMLEVVVEVREGTPVGKVVIATTDNLNPMRIVNPIQMIPDGIETNPSHDPANPDSQPTRTKYRKDLTEAFRVMLDRHLAMKVQAGA